MKLLLRLASALVLAALVIAGVLTAIGALYQPNTQIPTGFLGQHVTVNGLPLRVYQLGKGQDVLMIHGSPGSVEDWSPMFGALSTRLRLTAYDRPGHGFSGDSGAYSPSANAAGRKFICVDPTNPATNRLAGALYSSSGVPYQSPAQTTPSCWRGTAWRIR